MHIDEIRSNAGSRRLFLKRMSAAGLGVAAASLVSGGELFAPRTASGATPTPVASNITLSQVQTAFPGIPGNSVVEIVLNYALTLEILEADLYRQALNIATAKPLDTPLAASIDSYKNAVKPGFGFSKRDGDIGFLYLAQFAYVEAAHRDFLTAAITAAGGTPTTRNPGGYHFATPGHPSPGISYILGEILPLEETGVRAYLGALPYLGDALNYAQVAGGIYSTEARHSAAIRYIFGSDIGPKPRPGDMQVVAKYPSPNTFEYFLTPAQVLSAASVYFG